MTEQEPEDPGTDTTGIASVEEGTCALCGQTLLRATRHDGAIYDVWHPWTVEQTCPVEPAEKIDTEAGSKAWTDWYAAGNRPLRPGVEQFRPIEETP